MVKQMRMCCLVSVLIAVAGPPTVLLMVQPWQHDDSGFSRPNEPEGSLPSSAEFKDALWAAARRGDATLVRELLAHGADVNAKTDYGATALSYAADKGHLSVVRVLLKNKADPNTKDTFYQETPLGWAVSRGHAEIVGALLQAGAEGADQGLGTAVALGKLDVVQAFLDKGKLKEEALTKALAATPAKYSEIAEALKRAGAKPADASSDDALKAVVDRETLASYVGAYRNVDGQEFKVALSDGKPVLEFFDQKMEMRFTDKTSFQLPAANELIFKFTKEEEKVTGLALKRGDKETVYNRIEPRQDTVPKAVVDDSPAKVDTPANWPSFRGPGATGVADGQFPPTV